MNFVREFHHLIPFHGSWKMINFENTKGSPYVVFRHCQRECLTIAFVTPKVFENHNFLEHQVTSARFFRACEAKKSIKNSANPVFLKWFFVCKNWFFKESEAILTSRDLQAALAWAVRGFKSSTVMRLLEKSRVTNNFRNMEYYLKIREGSIPAGSYLERVCHTPGNLALLYQDYAAKSKSCF